MDRIFCYCSVPPEFLYFQAIPGNCAAAKNNRYTVQLQLAYGAMLFVGCSMLFAATYEFTIDAVRISSRAIGMAISKRSRIS